MQASRIFFHVKSAKNRSCVYRLAVLNGGGGGGGGGRLEHVACHLEQALGGHGANSADRVLQILVRSLLLLTKAATDLNLLRLLEGHRLDMGASIRLHLERNSSDEFLRDSFSRLHAPRLAASKRF